MLLNQLKLDHFIASLAPAKMPKECGSWRASCAEACHTPPGHAHPSALSADTESAPGPAAFSSATLLLRELAHSAHVNAPDRLKQPLGKRSFNSQLSGNSAVPLVVRTAHVQYNHCMKFPPWGEKSFWLEKATSCHPNSWHYLSLDMILLHG